MAVCGLVNVKLTLNGESLPFMSSCRPQCAWVEKSICTFKAPHFTLVKEALIDEIGCVVTSLVVGWLSLACTVAKRCILGL